jgi:hypothetical protein
MSDVNFNLWEDTKDHLREEQYGDYEVAIVTTLDGKTRMEMKEFMYLAKKYIPRQKVSDGDKWIVSPELVLVMDDGSRFVRTRSEIDGYYHERWTHQTAIAHMKELPKPVLFTNEY